MDFSHPAFEPYQTLLAQLPQNCLPTVNELDVLARKIGLKIRFVESTVPLSGFAYERGILETGAIPTRPGNMHDLMNAMVWLTFPAFKSALNRAHCRAFAENPAETRQRSPFRDALTLLDESGVLVFTEDPGFSQHLANRRWHQLFIEGRQALLLDTRFYVVGHAILEKLLDPYPSITGKCLVIPDLPEEITRADQIAHDTMTDITNTKQLLPLPVAGIPGWHSDNHLPLFYDNTSIFRPLAH